MKSSILLLSTLLALATAAPVPEAGPVLGFGGHRCQMRGGPKCKRDVETSAPVENIVKRDWRCQMLGGRFGCNKRDVETSAPVAHIVERDVSEQDIAERDISEHDLTKRRGPRKTCGPPTGRKCKKDVETSAPAEDMVERDVSEQDIAERDISEQDLTKRNRWHGRPCGKQFGIKC